MIAALAIGVVIGSTMFDGKSSQAVDAPDPVLAQTAAPLSDPSNPRMKALYAEYGVYIDAGENFLEGKTPHEATDFMVVRNLQRFYKDIGTSSIDAIPLGARKITAGLYAGSLDIIYAVAYRSVWVTLRFTPGVGPIIPHTMKWEYK